MDTKKRVYARHIYNRGLQTLWKGDAANPGSRARSVVLVTNEFNSTIGVFQVYALEAVGKGIENGKFAGTAGEPTLLFDEDFNGLDAAAKKFRELVEQAEADGFKTVSIWDELEFEEKIRTSRK